MEFVFLLGILLLVVGFGFYVWTMIRSIQTRVRNIEEFIREGGMTQQPSALMEHMRNTVNEPEHDMNGGITQDEDRDDGEGVWSGLGGESGIAHIEEEKEGVVRQVELDLAKLTMEDIGEDVGDAGAEVEPSTEVVPAPASPPRHTHDSLERLKVPELKSLLNEMGVAFASGSRKVDLIRLVLSKQEQNVKAADVIEEGDEGDEGDEEEGDEGDEGDEEGDVMDVEEQNEKVGGGPVAAPAIVLDVLEGTAGDDL